MTQVAERIEFIRKYDPDGASRLERLLSKKDNLLDRNVYGERFTERQFLLVFEPLLELAYQRARVLEVLADQDNTISGISERLSMEQIEVFEHIKELLRKNLVEIVSHDGRDAVIRRHIR